MLRPMLVFAVMLALGGCATTKDSANKPGSDTAAGDAEGWQATFVVDKRSLKPTGEGAYMSLVPGSQWAYRGEDVVLTITVLNETRLVDGVTTRVVEEREEEDGKLKEVSRNFMAIDPATGDVYYFGEEVDIYKNGKITGHEGAWMSGVNGARFGLLVPGRPDVGARFHQEVAPGVAMDRAEVASVDEQVTTPAGVYAHCLHIVETTPLEKGKSHKWFAPGVGLVKDDEEALVSSRRVGSGGR
ncbi:MAG TPA: hypothetical protein VG797_08630 [Phycisphaerales bacterium]|nr:hypothetical protein [Phycisphaerales bacterium]